MKRCFIPRDSSLYVARMVKSRPSLSRRGWRARPRLDSRLGLPWISLKETQGHAMNKKKLEPRKRWPKMIKFSLPWLCFSSATNRQHRRRDFSCPISETKVLGLRTSRLHAQFCQAATPYGQGKVQFPVSINACASIVRAGTHAQ